MAGVGQTCPENEKPRYKNSARRPDSSGFREPGKELALLLSIKEGASSTMSTQAAFRIDVPSRSEGFEEALWSHRRGSALAAVVDGVRVVHLMGACSHEDFLELCHLIPRWEKRNPGGLIIDFSATKWHDLVGVRCLVKSLVWVCEERGMRVCLVRPPLDVRVVLRYMESPAFIGCVSTLRHGLEQVRNPETSERAVPDDCLMAALPGDGDMAGH